MSRIKLILQGIFIGVIIGSVVALLSLLIISKAKANNNCAWDSSGYFTNGGYSPCPPNASCVFPNGATLTGPLTFSAGSSMTSTIQNPSIQSIIPTAPITTSINYYGGNINMRTLTYIDSGLYATGSTTCGIQEAANELQKEGLISFGFIRPMTPCFITTPLALQNMTNLTIGGYGAEGNNSPIIFNGTPMESGIYITGTGVTYSVKFSNISFYNLGGLTASFISEDTNTLGVFHNCAFYSTNSAVLDFYTVNMQSEEYTNIVDINTAGAFISSTMGNSGQSSIIDNYEIGGGNLVVYSFNGGLQISRIWAEGGGVYITQAAGGSTVSGAFKLDQVGYVGKGLNLYGVWNATISNPFIDGGINIDANSGNIVVENPSRADITNLSTNPVLVIGQYTDRVLTGAIVCEDNHGTGMFGTGLSFYSCGTVDYGNIAMTKTGIAIQSSTGTWFTGGTYVDSLTLNGNVQPMVIAGTGQYTNGVYNGNYKGFTASQYATCTVTPISTSNTMGTPVVTSGTGTAWTATSVTSEFLYQYLNYGLGTAPYAIVTDSLKNIWVMNYNSNNVTKLNPALGVQGTFTTGSYSFSLAVDAANELWVPLYASNIVLVLNTAGTIISEYTVGFSNPKGIVIDKSGNVWVSNYGNYSTTEIPYNGGNGITSNVAVARFQGIAIDSNGDAWVAVTSKVVKIPHLGGNGITYSGFTTAQNIAVDSNDNKWIVDVGANVVVEMPAAGGNGFSYTGSFINQGIPLVGIVIDANDHVWVSQTAAGVNTIKEYAQGITIGTYYTGAAPNGVAISNEGNIYVSGGGIPYNVTKISPAGLIITTDNSSFNYVCTIR